MPIMVRNVIKAKPETVLKIKEKYYDDEYFDLEKIEKMPPRLDFSVGSETVNAILYAIYLKSESELETLENDMKQRNVDLEYLTQYVFKSGMTLNEIKNSFTNDELEKIEHNAKIFSPWIAEERLGVKTLEDLGNLCLNNMLEYNSIARSDWCNVHWGTYAAYVDESKKEDTMIIDSEWGTPKPLFIKLSKEFPEDTFYIEYEDDAGYSSGNMIIRNCEIIEEHSLDDSEIEEEEMFDY